MSRASAKPAAPDSNNDSGLEKFPDHIDSPLYNGSGTSVSPIPGLNIYSNGINGTTTQPPSGDRWLPKREPRKSIKWGQLGQPPPSSAYGLGQTRQTRQKSISETFRTIRDRNGSVSQNAQDIAGALRAPLSYKLIVRHHASFVITKHAH